MHHVVRVVNKIHHEKMSPQDLKQGCTLYFKDKKIKPVADSQANLLRLPEVERATGDLKEKKSRPRSSYASGSSNAKQSKMGFDQASTGSMQHTGSCRNGLIKSDTSSQNRSVDKSTKRSIVMSRISIRSICSHAADKMDG